MQQASIHNLLVAIPSQASNFAFACVGQILEEQIQDPRKMANNLKRIGSVVSDWSSALTGEMNGAGDAGGVFRGLKHAGTLIDLPEKIRHKILACLSNKDIMNARLVCSKMRFDIDHGIGLPVIMDTASESMQWLQKVTTKSCFCTRVENFLYFNFLPKPERMENLHFHQNIYIPPEMLDLVLRKFNSLRQVIFSTEDLYHPVDGRMLSPVSPSVTSELIDILMKKDVLHGIRVQFNDKTSRTEWKLELRPEISPSHSEHTTNIGQLHLQIPRQKVQQQTDSLRLLDYKHKLFELKSDLPGIKWNSYIKTISENSKTLTGLHLLNLKCTKEPFDCNVLKNCVNLRFLSLSGDKDNYSYLAAFDYLPVAGFNWLSSKKLCTLSLENVFVIKYDFEYLKEELKKTVWIHMKGCLGGSESIADLKLGDTSSQSEWPEMPDCETEKSLDIEFDDEMSHLYYGFDNGARRSCATAMISEIMNAVPTTAIKGLLLTAWIAYC